MNGTSDNILDLVKFLEQQKLSYTLAIWSPQPDNQKDKVVIYTSFDKSELKKFNQAVQTGEIINEVKH